MSVYGSGAGSRTWGAVHFALLPCCCLPLSSCPAVQCISPAACPRLNLMQWDANPAGRRRTEYRLKVMWTVRVSCFTGEPFGIWNPGSCACRLGLPVDYNPHAVPYLLPCRQLKRAGWMACISPCLFLSSTLHAAQVLQLVGPHTARGGCGSPGLLRAACAAAGHRRCRHWRPGVS